ncbi:ribbon-helix-helix protein, CopG family [Rathayibacter sp. VKM Ac-2804]|uniref:ribbon-helix-helix domain-containing protein n=1 Tax=unclassified Rathayibacter TaxID=2609250 RepID=UPI00132EA799|nr:CopG family transcriptional regulator [Rathayibacter sp. VKM Ac-2804]NRG42147.1 ribbon-helix-helix protein, CopG family [Rathayibacter sp. VKM Ac-2835]QHF22654.1 ribbon-helix-helix protein, CopG family [Rathayibacter sp. VKM Ac-2804]
MHAEGADAADDARAALLAATGAATLDDAVIIARGRPRLDGGEPAGPVWKVRSTRGLDQEVSRLAKSRGVSKSQILREAAAAYVEAS